MLTSTATTILDYVRVLVWPAVVVSGATYAFWRWGKHIGPLIDRIKTVKAPGIEVGFEPQPQDDEDAAEARAEESVEGMAELVDAYEQALADQAEEAQEQQLALGRQLAVTQIQLDYERTYRVIYGSQIAALRALRAAPGEPSLSRNSSLISTPRRPPGQFGLRR
jgi:hypothetical protein